MKISVIIPAYNEEKYLGDCLASVLKFRYPELWEVIVIDNASSDDTAAVAQRFDGVRLIQEPRKGLTKARQRGLSEASGDLLAFLDADSRISDNWFYQLVAEFAADPNLVCLSGPYEYYGLSNQHQRRLIGGWLLLTGLFNKIFRYAIYGGNFAAKRQSLMEAGGFDVGIDFYGEDTDIARRLSRLGRVKFSKQFYVYSSARRFNSEGIKRTAWRYGLNYLWVAMFGRPLHKSHQDIR